MQGIDRALDVMVAKPGQGGQWGQVFAHQQIPVGDQYHVLLGETFVWLKSLFPFHQGWRFVSIINF